MSNQNKKVLLRGGHMTHDVPSSDCHPNFLIDLFNMKCKTLYTYA